MKSLIYALSVLLIGSSAFAAIRCAEGNEKIVVDPHRKEVEIIKDGQVKKVAIISRNSHGYGMFGEKTYELQGGYILGFEQRITGSPKKDLTVFKNGEPVASYHDCSL